MESEALTPSSVDVRFRHVVVAYKQDAETRLYKLSKNGLLVKAMTVLEDSKIVTLVKFINLTGDDVMDVVGMSRPSQKAYVGSIFDLIK